jgi:hypothetical protein
MSACLWRKGTREEQARVRVAGGDEFRHYFEVLAGLFLGPEGLAGREFLQLERVSAVRMADLAADMIGTLLEKHGLDTGFEKLVIERRIRCR